MINKLVIIGVGLIGGSLARAVKQAGFCNAVIGYGRDEATLQKAEALGVIDNYDLTLPAAVRDADVVVLAVPMGAMEAVLKGMAADLGENTVVTDAGSAKASVTDAARQHLREKFSNFVPGHPIAGTEHSGVEASFAELYQHRRVILTPTPETSPQALGLVRQMWQAAGAVIEEMDVVQHDEILAATSHLPHLLAYNLINTLIALDESEEIFRFSAGGFRDFTRIASSSPQMWRDILMSNQQSVLGVLDQYIDDLQALRAAIEQKDGEFLENTFGKAKAARDRHVADC